MELTLALIGFGNVGRALVRLMQRKHDELRDRHNLTWRVTGISTGRHGLAADPDRVGRERRTGRCRKRQASWIA